MRDAVILATSRTPIGRAFKGSLVDVRPDDMSAFIIDDVLSKVPAVDPASVEDVIWGVGQPAGEAGYNIARVAGILAGLQAPGVTVNRYCSSSLQTIRMAAHAIAAGEGDCFVAGGVETISRYGAGMADDKESTRNPRFADAEERSAVRAGGGEGDWTPPAGFPDIYIAMGQTAENVAELKSVSRQRQDEFACLSQNRAEAARDRGFFEREITPYPLDDGKLLQNDDGIRAGTTMERLADLLPAFRPDGTVTAGNCCPLNDGAAAVLVTSAERAAELGVAPLARIVSSGVSALDPEIMGLGPVGAVRQALARAGMTIDDIDHIEINEAFAAQVIASADELGIDWEKLNPNGGAIALGHPFGMTGSRIMGTLLNGLEDADGEIGLETMCVGGGQGVAMIVQRLS
ncbi:MAG: acetyl-CoA C-acetyltransferase [bacterium]|nr:acetyl-CoA C-acetyltransferase [bacterium]